MSVLGHQTAESIECEVRRWLEVVVIGLNLCPFAGVPYGKGQIRVFISLASTPEALLDELRGEFRRLDETPRVELETTLVVLTGLLADFEDYNQFLDVVDDLLRHEDREGVYQVASFHPHYRFDGTEPDDLGNLTNRAPWPILHLLREESVEQAVESHSDVEAIPARNIQLMESLSADQVRAYFPWLSE